MNLRAGGMLGKWRLVSPLAETAHSSVWIVANDGGIQGALKAIKGKGGRGKEEAARLSAEIRAMRACQDIEGVLPLLDSHIDEGDAGGSWLVSAPADPLDKLEWELSLISVVDLCLALAKCLSVMHGRGYYHRDIKPPNVFRYGGRWCLGDFGLVDFPEKEPLTTNVRRLGPQYYIAPEMLNSPSEAEGGPADVYSLGKLFWQQATGSNFPMPGTHDRLVPALTISEYFPAQGAAALDGLLEAMTRHAPESRPTIDVVVNELEAWKAPPPPPSGPLDLRPYAKRAAVLVEPFSKDRDRRARLQNAATDARNRAFHVLSGAMTEIDAVLQQTFGSIGSIEFVGPAGGNDNFIKLVPNYANTGTNDKPAWAYEHSIRLTLSGRSEMVHLLIGSNLVMQQVAGERGEVHDLAAPVLAAVGWVVSGHKTRGQEVHHWQSTQTQGVDHGEFYYGRPSEAVTLTRLDRSLRSLVQPAVQAMLEAFEELQKP